MKRSDFGWHRGWVPACIVVINALLPAKAWAAEAPGGANAGKEAVVRLAAEADGPGARPTQPKTVSDLPVTATGALIEPIRMPVPGVDVRAGAAAAVKPTGDAVSTVNAPALTANTLRRDKLQAAVAGGVSPEAVKAAMLKGPADKDFRMLLEEVRGKAKPALLAERVAPKAAPAPTPGKALSQPAAVPAKAAALPRQPPHKLALQPIPGTVGSARESCEREDRIKEVELEVAEETDPGMRERRLLVLAANHVGQGNYGQAKSIYDNLAISSSDSAVLQTVGRNLRVVDKRVAIILEADAAKRERLELELAQIHQDMGHAKVAKELCRALAAQAAQPEVKAEARRLLATGADVKPEQHLDFLKAQKARGAQGGVQ